MASKLKSSFSIVSQASRIATKVSLRPNIGVLSRTYANEGGEGWLSKLLHVKRVEPATKSHAMALTNKDLVYEMQVHNIKPDCMGDYIKLSDHHLRRVHEKSDYPCELFGSWSTAFGPQDQAVHIWIYKGFDEVKKMSELLWEDKDYLEYKKLRGEMLVGRSNQLLMPFSFWGDPPQRDSSHLYELRSYHLRPGTLIEWGNNWAKGIVHRREQNESVLGLFTQIGDLYLVHHIWAYKDLQTRKEIRDAAWRKPGWDDCVAYTVPLIRRMETKIMIPLPCSPQK
ncbi:protein NipSnap homolog 2-like [Lytechinus variegatus]|uniref:protein NipSnap homolog 2-like n=1 Tax=Lytechinus variegatus TaxID=7654 RepID=UPI001BB18E84|nr:protein NipSnap homolog 2-like [Lytechinus variegatus]